jgi:glycosyltransferase involved in cell wall biosynthesis
MRLAPRKRPVHLLRILAEIRRQVPARIELRAVIIGTGPEQAAMERFLDRHRMRDWVELAGRCDRETIRRVHAESDVYLAPATLESFGIAALEARTSGLPVVARSGSGVGEFVTDGVNGFMAEDDESMAAALARLASDDTLRERMRAHNLDQPPAQDWPRVAELAEAEYLRAVGARVRA